MIKEKWSETRMNLFLKTKVILIRQVGTHTNYNERKKMTFNRWIIEDELKKMNYNKEYINRQCKP